MISDKYVKFYIVTRLVVCCAQGKIGTGNPTQIQYLLSRFHQQFLLTEDETPLFKAFFSITFSLVFSTFVLYLSLFAGLSGEVALFKRGSAVMFRLHSQS